MKKLIKNPFLWIGVGCMLFAIILPFLGIGGHFRSSFVSNVESFVKSPGKLKMNIIFTPEDRDKVLEFESLEDMKKEAKLNKSKFYVGESEFSEDGTTGKIDAIVESTSVGSGSTSISFYEFSVEKYNRKYVWKNAY